MRFPILFTTIALTVITSPAASASDPVSTIATSSVKFEDIVSDRNTVTILSKAAYGRHCSNQQQGSIDHQQSSNLKQLTSIQLGQAKSMANLVLRQEAEVKFGGTIRSRRRGTLVDSIQDARNDYIGKRMQDEIIRAMVCTQLCSDEVMKPAPVSRLHEEL